MAQTKRDDSIDYNYITKQPESCERWGGGLVSEVRYKEVLYHIAPIKR